MTWLIDHSIALAHLLIRMILAHTPYDRNRVIHGGSITMQPTTISGSSRPDPSEKNNHKEVINGLYNADRLDHRIGLRPRMKSSSEVHFLLTTGFHALNKAGQGPYLPEAMQKIIRQFMIANKYVGSGSHLAHKRELQNSLLVRLDLHNPSNKAEKQRFDCCKGDIFTFVAAQTREWRERGFITRWTEGSFPSFHTCVGGWTLRCWNGTMPEIAPGTLPTTSRLNDGTLGPFTGSVRSAIENSQEDTRSRHGRSPVETTHNGAYSQYVRKSQATEQPYVRLPYRYLLEISPHKLPPVGSSFPNTQRAQTVNSAFVPRAPSVVPQEFIAQARKRPIQYYNERREPKRHCSGTLCSTTDPPVWINPTMERNDVHNIHALQDVGNIRKSNVLQPLSNNGGNQTLRSSQYTTHGHKIQNPADTDNIQLPPLRNNLIPTYSSFPRLRALASEPLIRSHRMHSPADMDNCQAPSMLNIPAQSLTLETQLSFSHVLSTLNYAHTNLSNFAPTSLAEFSALSRYWKPSEAKTSCLTELLLMCKEHVDAVGKYFESAIELMEILLREQRCEEEVVGKMEEGEAGKGEGMDKEARNKEVGKEKEGKANQRMAEAAAKGLGSDIKVRNDALACLTKTGKF